MCTTDAYQGFRKLTNFLTVALAVSQSKGLVEGKAYDAPAGWHWVTAAEVEAVPGWTNMKCKPYNYATQGGWAGCTWEGVERCVFFFRAEGGPTAGRTHVIHVQDYEGTINEYAMFHSSWGIACCKAFAGIVCVQD
jgi:hypothetical protein